LLPLVAEAGWFWRDAGWLGEAEFSEGAVDVPIVHAVDGLTDVEVLYVAALRRDVAGEFVAWNGVGALGSGFCLCGGLPFEFGGNNAGGVDADKDVCFTRCWGT